MRIQASTVTYLQPQKPARKTGVACPHGNPGGACPLCRGMGGGGLISETRNKPTPKELGLLTWADLLPVWYAMQAAKLRKENEQKLDRLNEILLIMQKNQAFQAALRLVEGKILPLLRSIDANILKPAVQSLKTAMSLISTLVGLATGIVAAEISKLAIVLALKSEKFINENINRLMNMLFKGNVMLQAAAEKFVSFVKETEKAMKEFFEDLSRKTKKRLLRIIESTDLFFAFEEKEHMKKVLLIRESEND